MPVPGRPQVLTFRAKGAGAEHHFGHALPQAPLGIDARVRRVHERETRELLERSFERLINSN